MSELNLAERQHLTTDTLKSLRFCFANAVNAHYILCQKCKNSVHHSSHTPFRLSVLEHKNYFPYMLLFSWHNYCLNARVFTVKSTGQGTWDVYFI